jgi:type IX secretion system PorP/SprF family membrane protein
MKYIGMGHLVSGAALIIFIGLNAQSGYAQFIPYSQYYNSPLLTNPSQAGLSDFAQLTIHYRRSRIANYEIPSVSFVHPFYRHRDGLRAGGLGASLISQQAGPGGAYRIMGALGTFAYNIHLSRKHHISAGLQGGIVNKRLDLSDITTDNQFNFGAFDPSRPTGENFQSNAVSKPVINSGFSWTWTDTSNVQKAMLGIAFSNMNRPSYAMLSDDDRENLVYTVSGEMLLMQRGRTSVHPTFRYIRGTTSFADIGVQLCYRLAREDRDIRLGGWYKTTEAIVAAVQYNNPSYTLATSMDFSAANNLQANINNAIEFSFGWRLKRKGNGKRKSAASSAANVMSSGPEAPEVTEEKSVEDPEAAEVASPEPVQDIVMPPLEAVQDEITPAEASTLSQHINFKLGSSELTHESVQFIETRLASIVRNHPQCILYITGHSCTIGDHAINEKISFERAEAIGKILLEQGIPRKRMVMTGRDFQKPVASNDTEEGRQKNRRVEFELVRE